MATWKALPSPNALSTEIVPPWSLHQLPNQRKADTATLMAAAIRSLYPMKSLEQLSEFVRGDANARIAHGYVRIPA